MAPFVRPTPYTEKIRELVESSFAFRYDDLATMFGHSTAAVALIEALAQEEIPDKLVVAAWTQHGNAFRLIGRQDEAERWLAKAATLPVSDMPTRVHLLEVKASLHRNTGRFESAADLLATAIEAQRSVGSSDGEARLHNLLGLVHLDAGDLSRAIPCFQTALDLLTSSAPPALFISAGHNLFETLIEAGDLVTAAETLAVLEPTYRRFTSTRIVAKADWMRARLYRAMSHLAAARLAYDRAYALLKTQPLSPDLAELATEIAAFTSPLPAAGA